MFHPIGSKPAVVYWRRRLLLVGLVVLVGLTMYVACSSGSSKPAAEPDVAQAEVGTPGNQRCIECSHHQAVERRIESSARPPC